MKRFTVKKNQKWFQTSMILCCITITVLLVFGQARA